MSYSGVPLLALFAAGNSVLASITWLLWPSSVAPSACGAEGTDAYASEVRWAGRWAFLGFVAL